MATSLIDAKEAQQRIRLGRTAFDKLVMSGQFPAPIRLGGRRRFIESEVDEYITNLVATQRGAAEGTPQ